MRSIALRLGIIGAIAGGAFILRPFLSGNAGSLAVGDCFDEPAVITDVVEDVQHHPCTEAHDGEVVYVGDYSPASDTYPTDEAFFEFEKAQCLSAFQQYTGIDFTLDESYGMATFRPTAEGWKGGDRTVTCYAYLIDESKLTKSIKKAA